jgi:serine/threonine protein kinase
MRLAPGARLGAYETTTAIGHGGMGEVYRATDTNLKRDVALNVLPAAVAADVKVRALDEAPPPRHDRRFDQQPSSFMVRTSGNPAEAIGALRRTIREFDRALTVVRAVVGDAMLIVSAGPALGLGFALVAARGLRGVVYGVSTTDR